MKKIEIAYYISSYGYGHLTRSLALIERILETTKNQIYICSGERQLEFAKIYLNKYLRRLKFSQVTTDIGLINKLNSLEVDVEMTNEAVKRMLYYYEEYAQEEANVLSLFNTQLIISDVSAFACLVGKILNIRVIEIGNYTWVDQYKNIGVQATIINEFEKLYNYCTDFIAYDLSLDFMGAREGTVFRSKYLISRPIDEKRVQGVKNKFKYKYETKMNTKCKSMIYLSLGKSSQLPKMEVENFEGVIFYTDGIDFNQVIHPRIMFVKIPNEIKDSQLFIAASDLLISKSSWSTVAEGLVAHTKTIIIESKSTNNDIKIIKSLKERELISTITIEELINLDYETMYQRAINEINISKLNEIHNNTDEMSKKILSYI